MRPGSAINAREALQLIYKLPIGGAFTASIAADRPPGEIKPDDSPQMQALRRAQRWRGWNPQLAAIKDIRDILAGSPSPRPWDADGVALSSRQVVDVIPI